jgi:hypothetical protein
MTRSAEARWPCDKITRIRQSIEAQRSLREQEGATAAAMAAASLSARNALRFERLKQSFSPESPRFHGLAKRHRPRCLFKMSNLYLFSGCYPVSQSFERMPRCRHPAIWAARLAV